MAHLNIHSDVEAQVVRPLDGRAVRIVDADRVASVRETMPAGQDVTDLADVFGLLSDPGRLRLLVALLEGEMCVCDLAAAAELSESAASHALRLLRAHRVVEVRKDGRRAWYRLADAHVRMLLDLALAHVGHTTAVGIDHTTLQVDHIDEHDITPAAAAGRPHTGHTGPLSPSGDHDHSRGCP